MSMISVTARIEAANNPEAERFAALNREATAAKRPELGIDVGYVLTGGRLSEHGRQAIDSARRSGLGDQRLVDSAEVETARNNALLAPMRKQLEAVVQGCRDGNNLALLLALAERLAEAERLKVAAAARAGNK